MFIGHYAPALMLKRHAPAAPLGALFVAVQFVDILFFVFVVSGIEHMRFIPGFTRSNPMDLYFMPYTHSAVATLFWGAVVGATSGAVWRNWRVGVAMGVAVMSHFVLDWVVHTPDLPLDLSNQTKIGLGLWNQPVLCCAVETALLAAGFWWLGWWRQRRAQVLFAFGALVTWLEPVVPPGPTVWFFALQAEFFYALLAGMAVWVERAAPTDRR